MKLVVARTAHSHHSIIWINIRSHHLDLDHDDDDDDDDDDGDDDDDDDDDDHTMVADRLISCRITALQF